MNQTTYPFKFEGVSPSVGVVKAVAFVVGRDPMDLGQIANILDPDALNNLILDSDGVTVSFTMAGVDVEVNSAGEILVTDLDPIVCIPAYSEEISNVMLLAVSRKDKVCLDLLSPTPDSEQNLLLVKYSSLSGNELLAWQENSWESYTSATVIQVGGFTRSTSGSTNISDVPLSPTSFVVVPDSQDLSELEITIIDWLTRTEQNGQVICFDSITDLLTEVGRDRAIEFLQEVTRKTSASNAIAHFHLDPGRLNQTTISELAELFDLSAYIGENGHWEITAEFES